MRQNCVQITEIKSNLIYLTCPNHSFIGMYCFFICSLSSINKIVISFSLFPNDQFVNLSQYDDITSNTSRTGFPTCNLQRNVKNLSVKNQWRNRSSYSYVQSWPFKDGFVTSASSGPVLLLLVRNQRQRNNVINQDWILRRNNSLPSSKFDVFMVITQHWNSLSF